MSKRKLTGPVPRPLRVGAMPLRCSWDDSYDGSPACLRIASRVIVFQEHPDVEPWSLVACIDHAQMIVATAEVNVLGVLNLSLVAPRPDTVMAAGPPPMCQSEFKEFCRNRAAYVLIDRGDDEVYRIQLCRQCAAEHMFEAGHDGQTGFVSMAALPGTQHTACCIVPVVADAGTPRERE